jgi:cellulose synthase/poly-beta-1,6-N-acetylglucosamine synthase-like glycosyltransferase
MAVHNEVPWLAETLGCLRALDYPADRLRFVIVDGASADGTAAFLASIVNGDSRFRLLTHSKSDKVSQINAALQHADAHWIAVADADARLAPDVVRRLVAAGEADSRALALGTSVRPDPSHPLERLYWRLADRLRLLESASGCASIVTGPCYLFRRSLLDRFPDDVVADDVHVAMLSAVEGGVVRFLDLDVTESRSPLRLWELYRHKLRKADAYLRELFRFLTRLSSMPARAREIFLWRAGHMVLVPLLLGTGAVAAVWALVAAGAGALAAGGIAGAALLALAVDRLGLWRDGTAWLAIPLAALLATVLLAALVFHPFSRQTAHYARIGSALSPAREMIPEGAEGA